MPRRSPTLGRWVLVAAGIGVLVGAGPAGLVRGQQPAPPEPTFRTDASFVLTDVFVTAGGTPVTDLTQADFEVREDGVVQTVRSFEAIAHRPQPVGVPRRNPSTVAESNAMIGDPRRRVFVVFLDTYHVDRGSAMRMRKGLEEFLRTALGPDDLVAYMTPQMSGRDISFSTSTEPLIRYLADNPAWGVADELMGQEEDRTERDLQACFGDTKEQRDAWLALRGRLREQKSIEALRGLVLHLDGHREARKAVIVATLGWRLFTDNPARMTDEGTDGQTLGVEPFRVGPTGRLGQPDRGPVPGIDRRVCDVARLHGANADSRVMFRELIGEANRASTSFYTVDAAGLRVDMDRKPSTVGDMQLEARRREKTPFTTTLDAIRTLASATNGLAVADGNDYKAGLDRIAADFNAFYLLGYTSSNGQADGKYRTITVTVKRPGVQVRAREGYLARRIDERPASSPSAGGDTPNAEATLLAAALSRLAPARPGVPLVVSAVAGAAAGGAARVIRVTAELDPAIAAAPEWADGGEALATVRNPGGDTVSSGTSLLDKGARIVEIQLPVVDGMTGDVKVQVRLSGTGALARYTDTTTVTLDAVPTGWGAPRLSRRGPSTGIVWVATADPRFRRQERVRVTVGVGPDAGAITGTLLDRQGRPINVPVKIDRAEPAALVAELALAPLAAGDYVMALAGSGGPRRLLVPLRVVP